MGAESSPFTGDDLAGLALSTLVRLPARVFHLRAAVDRGVGAETFTEPSAGAAVLLDTGWDRHFGTEAHGHPAPSLTRRARALVEVGDVLVGIDPLNNDDTARARPAPTGPPAAAARCGCARGGAPDRVAPAARARRDLPGGAAGDQRFGTFPVRAYAAVDDLLPG